MTEKTDSRMETEDCWKHIGVYGDRTCSRLPAAGHCQNCPRYSAMGAALLDREPPGGYAREWAALLAREKEIEARGTISVVILRLGEEWLALSTDIFREVIEVGRVHTIPHRANAALIGLVNVRGEIHLCVSLAALLGHEEPARAVEDERRRAYPRMVVVARRGDRWVFPVDEVQGVHRFHPTEIRNVPVTVSNAAATFTRGVFDWEGKSVGHLDEELLFSAFARSVS